MSDQTQPMPPAQPPRQPVGGQPSAPATPQPGGPSQPVSPPVGGPGGPGPGGPGPGGPGPGGPGPGGPGPGGPGPGGPSGPPPHGPGPWQGPSEPAGHKPGLWRQATSTTGGKIATGVALALSGLMLLGILAAGIVTIARVGDRWGDRRERVAELREDGGMGPGGRLERGDGNRGRGLGPGMGNGNGNDMSRGNGLLGRLGGVEHGEFTVTGTDGKAVVMTLQRGDVTAASATSLAVRSSDGFAQTYVVNDDTRVAGGSADDLEVGDDVVVLARKDGKVAVQVRPDRR